MNEKKLRKLFEYQKFSQNPHLEEIIRHCEGFSEELSDESLFAVAGGQGMDNQSEKEKNKTKTDI